MDKEVKMYKSELEVKKEKLDEALKVCFAYE